MLVLIDANIGVPADEDRAAAVERVPVDLLGPEGHEREPAREDNDTGGRECSRAGAHRAAFHRGRCGRAGYSGAG